MLAHTTVGSPLYLSPELCADSIYGSKADCWALGCILYQLCTLTHPFMATNQAALVIKIMKGHVVPIETQRKASIDGAGAGRELKRNTNNNNNSTTNQPLPSSHLFTSLVPLSSSLHRIVYSLLNLNPHHRPSCRQILASEPVYTRMKQQGREIPKEIEEIVEKETKGEGKGERERNDKLKRKKRKKKKRKETRPSQASSSSSSSSSAFPHPIVTRLIRSQRVEISPAVVSASSSSSSSKSTQPNPSSLKSVGRVTTDRVKVLMPFSDINSMEQIASQNENAEEEEESDEDQEHHQEDADREEKEKEIKRNKEEEEEEELISFGSSSSV